MFLIHIIEIIASQYIIYNLYFEPDSFALFQNTFFNSRMLIDTLVTII